MNETLSSSSNRIRQRLVDALNQESGRQYAVPFFKDFALINPPGSYLKVHSWALSATGISRYCLTIRWASLLAVIVGSSWTAPPPSRLRGWSHRPTSSLLQKQPGVGEAPDLLNYGKIYCQSFSWSNKGFYNCLSTTLLQTIHIHGPQYHHDGKIGTASITFTPIFWTIYSCFIQSFIGCIAS